MRGTRLIILFGSATSSRKNFFHIESRDTGFMRYSTSNNTTIEGTIQRLIATLPKTDDELRLSYNLFKKLQAYEVDAGFCNACLRSLQPMHVVKIRLDDCRRELHGG